MYRFSGSERLSNCTTPLDVPDCLDSVPLFFPIQQRAPLRSFSRSRSSRCKVEYSPSHEDLTTGININFRQREKTIPFRPVRQRRLLVQQPVVREEMLWWKMRIWVMCVPCASYSDVTRTQVLAMMFFSLSSSSRVEAKVASWAFMARI